MARCGRLWLGVAGFEICWQGEERCIIFVARCGILWLGVARFGRVWNLTFQKLAAVSAALTGGFKIDFGGFLWNICSKC